MLLSSMVQSLLFKNRKHYNIKLEVAKKAKMLRLRETQRDFLKDSCCDL